MRDDAATDIVAERCVNLHGWRSLGMVAQNTAARPAHVP